MAWLLIRNPASGDRRAGREALRLARDRGFEVVETERAGHAVDLAAEAADRGVRRIAACGGDGTANEVVTGVDRAGHLSGTTLGVVPTGTGNGFAEDLGVVGVEGAFEVLDGERERQLDLGMAGDRPFLKSCVGGFLAGVSEHTTQASKRLLGVLAYGLGVLPYAIDAARRQEDPIPEIPVRVGPAGEPRWTGSAALLLVGNSRHFPGIVTRRADLEDGLLEVVVLGRSDSSGSDGASGRVRPGGPERLVDGTDLELRRFHVAELAVLGDEPTAVSLDGEVVERRHLDVRVRPGAMRMRVGPDYGRSVDRAHDGERR
jgi:diacylglycerol kinase family enzyme